MLNQGLSCCSMDCACQPRQTIKVIKVEMFMDASFLTVSYKTVKTLGFLKLENTKPNLLTKLALEALNWPNIEKETLFLPEKTTICSPNISRCGNLSKKSLINKT